MIIGDGDIHIVAWRGGSLNPTNSPTARVDGVATADGEIVKDFRIIPYLGPNAKICPACSKALAELRARTGNTYVVGYIQATKAVSPALAPIFTPQYD